ncbi:dienelactone hydrolase family protein [Heyndrickxia sp. FSL W8-0496]|uniref:alpha/beta hydrolase family protein n=1 Tax=Heyndrickxia sp. FSL W8-0496 TaxID=2954702 RepID=UPI0030F4C4A6
MFTNLKVGRVVKVVEDTSRKEIYTKGRGSRSFPISIFYPALENTITDIETNLISLFSPAIQEAIDIFSNVGIHIEKLKEVIISVKDHATPIPNTSFPVVLFSPGFGIDRDLYLEITTALVQKGYIVVAISVPYDSFLTVFPNGEVITQAERHPNDETQIKTRMQDVQLVVDSLEKWNQEKFFNGLFDTDKIAVLGHSLGGATVFNIAAIEERIRCAILYDASLHLIDHKMPNIPILNIRQEATSYEEYLDAILDEDDEEQSKNIAKRYIKKQMEMYEHLPKSSSFIKVIGAKHLSFSTISRLISDESPDVMKSIQELTIAFLQEFLSGNSGVYEDRINGQNRPTNCIKIDGSGLPIGNGESNVIR